MILWDGTSYREQDVVMPNSRRLGIKIDGYAAPSAAPSAAPVIP